MSNRSNWVRTCFPWALRSLAALVLLSVAFGLYGTRLDAPLVFDDLDFFSAHYVSTFGGEVSPLSRRFWSYASFAHQHLLFDHDFPAMRVGNILLHALTALALAALIRKLLALTAAESQPLPSFRGGFVAVMMALLFVVHPVAVYGVAYLVERTIQMAALFSLLTWLSYLHAIESGRKRWLWVSVLCFYLAVFSKEHAVPALLVPMGLSVLFWPRMRTGIGWRAAVPAFAAYTAFALLLVNASTALIGTTYEPMLAYSAAAPDWHQRWLYLERIHWLSLLTQGELFFKYSWLWLWPDPSAMSIDMRENLVAEIGDARRWLGLVGYLIYGLAGVGLLCRRGRTGLLGLGLLIPWAFFVVELATVRLQEPFVLYRSYLWMTGLMIALAVGFDRLAGRLRLSWLIPACVAVLGALVYSADQRLATFASEKLLWEDAVRLVEAQKDPALAAERAYYNRGVAYAKEGEHGRALADFDKALLLNPNYCYAHNMRGEIQAKRSQFEDALASFEQVLKICPNYAGARLRHANVLQQMGRSQESLAELKDACETGYVMACFAYQRRVDPAAAFVFGSPTGRQAGVPH